MEKRLNSHAFHACIQGFESPTGHQGRLAQLGEHLPYKQGVGGSIPSAPTIIINIFAGLAQLVEHLTCNQGVEGSSPLAGTTWSCGEVGVHAGLSHRRSRVRVPSAPPVNLISLSNAGVAQLVEHLTCNQGVVGSSPIAGTIKTNPQK